MKFGHALKEERIFHSKRLALGLEIFMRKGMNILLPLNYLIILLALVAQVASAANKRPARWCSTAAGSCAAREAAAGAGTWGAASLPLFSGVRFMEGIACV